jgi:dihydrolipoamide dehydrogenase
MRNGIGMLFKKNKVTHLQGFGRLKGKGKVEVEGPDGNRSVLRRRPRHHRHGIAPA